MERITGNQRQHDPFIIGDKYCPCCGSSDLCDCDGTFCSRHKQCETHCKDRHTMALKEVRRMIQLLEKYKNAKSEVPLALNTTINELARDVLIAAGWRLS